MGIIDLYACNKAKIAKLIWMIDDTKDIFWVKWVHGQYLKKKS